MTTNPPSSMPPSKVPGTGGGSAPFVLLAGVLVVVMGGLLCWKFKKAEPVADPAPSNSAPAPTRTVTDAPPPPPDDVVAVPDSSVAGKKPGAPSGGGQWGCSGTCAGTASAGMRGDISSRAGNARGCYERALRVNSTLQGKMTINLRVDQGGNVCSAAVSGDSIGDGNVSSCVLGMFRNARVTPPSGGCVDFSVPLNFQPKTK